MKAPKRAIELTLRISADSWDAVLGYTTLLRAVQQTHIGDQPALERGIETMRRLRRELLEVAEMAADPPKWLREVKS